MTNQPPYQPPQFPQEPEYSPPEDPYTEPPTPPPYANTASDASHVPQQPGPQQQGPPPFQPPAPQQTGPQQPGPPPFQPPVPPYQVPQQYQPAPPFNPAVPPFNPATPQYNPQFNPAVFPGQFPPQPPRKPVWPWIAGGAALLVLLVCGVGTVLYTVGRDHPDPVATGTTPPPTVSTTDPFADPTDEPTADPTTTGGGSTATGAIGKPVTDGDVEFTVKSMDCSKNTIGKPSSDSDFERKAEGHFCVVDLHISNKGSDQAVFSSAEQTAYGPTGSKITEDLLAEDAWATDHHTSAADNYYKPIKPGAAIDITLIYDVPVGGNLSKINLVGGFKSGSGVTVALS